MTTERRINLDSIKTNKKVYIISEGNLNTGYEVSVKCVCGTKELAEKIQKAFQHQNIHITEFEVL